MFNILFFLIFYILKGSKICLSETKSANFPHNESDVMKSLTISEFLKGCACSGMKLLDC